MMYCVGTTISSSSLRVITCAQVGSGRAGGWQHGTVLQCGRQRAGSAHRPDHTPKHGTPRSRPRPRSRLRPRPRPRQQWCVYGITSARSLLARRLGGQGWPFRYSVFSWRLLIASTVAAPRAQTTVSWPRRAQWMA